MLNNETFAQKAIRLLDPLKNPKATEKALSRSGFISPGGIVVTIIVSLWLGGMALFFKQPPNEERYKPKDEHISAAARIGIEAGINAILTQGMPHSQGELDRARIHARRLIEKVYPETKWQWPALETNGIDEGEV